MIEQMQADLNEIKQEIADLKNPIMEDGKVTEKSLYEQVKALGDVDALKEFEQRLDDLDVRKMELQTKIRVEAESVIHESAVNSSDIMNVYNRKSGNISDAEVEEQVYSLEKKATADMNRRKAPRTPEAIRKHWILKLVTSPIDLSTVYSISEFLRLMGDTRLQPSLGKAEREIINAMLPNKGSFSHNKNASDNLT